MFVGFNIQWQREQSRNNYSNIPDLDRQLFVAESVAVCGTPAFPDDVVTNNDCWSPSSTADSEFPDYDLQMADEPSALSRAERSWESPLFLVIYPVLFGGIIRMLKRQCWKTYYILRLPELRTDPPNSTPTTSRPYSRIRNIYLNFNDPILKQELSATAVDESKSDEPEAKKTEIAS